MSQIKIVHGYSKKGSENVPATQVTDPATGATVGAAQVIIRGPVPEAIEILVDIDALPASSAPVATISTSGVAKPS